MEPLSQQPLFSAEIGFCSVYKYWISFLGSCTRVRAERGLSEATTLSEKRLCSHRRQYTRENDMLGAAKHGVETI